MRRLDDLHELYAALAELQPAGSAALSPPPLVSPQEALKGRAAGMTCGEGITYIDWRAHGQKAV